MITSEKKKKEKEDKRQRPTSNVGSLEIDDTYFKPWLIKNQMRSKLFRLCDHQTRRKGRDKSNDAILMFTGGETEVIQIYGLLNEIKRHLDSEQCLVYH